jgi:hypothetical protein
MWLWEARIVLNKPLGSLPGLDVEKLVAAIVEREAGEAPVANAGVETLTSTAAGTAVSYDE